MKLKKLTRSSNPTTFFDDLNCGMQFSYSASFFYDEVEELARKAGVKIKFLDCSNGYVCVICKKKNKEGET